MGGGCAEGREPPDSWWQRRTLRFRRGQGGSRTSPTRGGDASYRAYFDAPRLGGLSARHTLSTPRSGVRWRRAGTRPASTGERNPHLGGGSIYDRTRGMRRPRFLAEPRNDKVADGVYSVGVRGFGFWLVGWRWKTLFGRCPCNDTAGVRASRGENAPAAAPYARLLHGLDRGGWSGTAPTRGLAVLR